MKWWMIMLFCVALYDLWVFFCLLLIFLLHSYVIPVFANLIFPSYNSPVWQPAKLLFFFFSSWYCILHLYPPSLTLLFFFLLSPLKHFFFFSSVVSRLLFRFFHHISLFRLNSLPTPLQCYINIAVHHPLFLLFHPSAPHVKSSMLYCKHHSVRCIAIKLS